MSAFSGILRLDGQAVERHDLTAMDQTLAAHGPDAQGSWVEGCFGISHRLMRMTPEDSFERQPLVSPEIVLAFDGRLDNRDELARMLQLDHSAERPDSEMLLAAWRRWGERCLDHLEGEFAFVIWQPRERHLFAAVDALGSRTFFFYHHQQWLIFATSPLAILTHPQVPHRLQASTLAGYLAIRRDYAWESFFEGIERLPPAHHLSAGSRGLTRQRYWNLPAPGSLHLPRDDDYPEALLELMQKSVHCRLRSCHAIGVSLSGGLDSSSVAWMAARRLGESGQRLRSYTSVPPPHFRGPVRGNNYSDETPLVLAQAACLGNLDTRFVQDGVATPLDGLEQWFAAGGFPIHATVNRTWMQNMLSQAAAEGTRVMLCGQVGNSTWSWSGMSRLPQLARNGHWLDLWHEASALARAEGGKPWRTLVGRGLLPALPFTWRRGIQRLRGRGRWPNSGLNPAAHALVSHFPDASQRQGHAMRRVSLASLSETWDSTHKVLSGVEMRDPCRDRRLVAFCLALPDEQFLKEGVSRRLIRRAMYGKLPPEVLNNTRRGIQAPDWHERLDRLRPVLPERLAQMATDPLARELLDLDLLQQLLQDWPTSGWDSSYAIKRYMGAFGRGLMAGEYMLWFRANYGPDAR